MSKPQTVAVLDYIKEHGSITPLDAMSELGVMRLASRVSELRACGYPIDTEMVRRKNRSGRVVSYASYRLSDDRPEPCN